MDAFYSFVLSAEVMTSNTMLNNSGEKGHPVLFLTLGVSSQFFPTEDDISSGSFIYGFYDLEV